MDEQNTPAPSGGPNMKLIGAVLLVLLIIGGAFLVLGKKAHEKMEGAEDHSMNMQTSPTTPPAVTSASPSGTMKAENVKEFSMTTGSFYFKPNTITVKKGDTVKITVLNEDASMFHNFSIDAFNVSVPLPAGKSQVITFTADKAGTFTFYCNIGSHATRGQKGTLTVQ